MKRTLAWLLMMGICGPAYAQFVGTRVVTENAYPGCIELSNQTTRLVLEPNLGGRVLKYELHGKNVIHVDPAFDGRIYQPGTSLNPTAGRFDIGPEKTVPRHPTLFQGKWTAAIIGDRRARIVSAADPATGVQLTRTFTLAESGSGVECTQTIRNVSNEVKRYCYWSRTLAKPNGIALVPLNQQSRYPMAYITYGPGDIINFRPAPDVNVRVREGILEILGPVKNPKFMTDGHDGWMAYITPDNQLFLKLYPVYPSRDYGEMAAGTGSVHYTSGRCEIEPIGPMETIAPGAEAGFTEYWHLLDFPFPDQRMTDLRHLREIIGDHMPVIKK